MNTKEYQKDIVLTVFLLLGTIHGTTFIQKFFFVLQKEILPKLELEYVPYHYGPFSRELNSLVKSLQQEELLSQKVTFTKDDYICRKFILTPTGKKLAESTIQDIDPKVIQDLKNFIEKFKHATPSQILKYVYEEYPKMTINSLLLD